jgi:hypothetical protein
MTEVNLDELQKYLADEDCKQLLTFCMEPKEWKEISKLKIKQSKMFKILKELKTSNALQFADGKYYSALVVKEYLE